MGWDETGWWFGAVCWLRAAVRNLSGTRDRCHGRQFSHGRGLGGGVGGNGSGSDASARGVADEASLASCCAVWYQSTAQGLGTPGLEGLDLTPEQWGEAGGV